MLLLWAVVSAMLPASGSAGEKCVIGVIGDSTVLPCSYKENEKLDPQTVSVEWRSDDGLVVHAFVQGRDALENQDPPYRERTELFTARLPEGNFSLRLSDVIKEDTGRYVCYFHKEDMESTKELDQVCMKVAAHYSEPELQGVRDPDVGYADFSCSSSGGFPEPRVHWLLNSQAPPVDTVRTDHTQDPVTGLYRVSSHLTVNITQYITVSCIIENPRLSENKTSPERSFTVQTKEDSNSGWTTGVAVGVVLAVGALVAAVVIYKKYRCDGTGVI